MDEFEEIRFLIPAYSADTMPLPRLLEYLRELSAVVGDGVSEEMHLLRIETSSTKPVFRMIPEAAVRAREQAIVVRTGRGTAKQRAAYDRVRRMVRHDGGKPAALVDRSGVILDFAPAVEEPEVTASVRQGTVFDGMLARVGGIDDTSTILMQDVSGEVRSGFTTTKSIAKEMGKYLFDPIRVVGIGNWDRHKVGGWKLRKMLIQAYEPLQDESLLETFRKLQDVKVQWPNNFDEMISRERESAL